jgi:hypothetical protein
VKKQKLIIIFLKLGKLKQVFRLEGSGHHFIGITEESRLVRLRGFVGRLQRPSEIKPVSIRLVSMFMELSS